MGSATDVVIALLKECWSPVLTALGVVATIVLGVATFLLAYVKRVEDKVRDHRSYRQELADKLRDGGRYSALYQNAVAAA